LRRIALPATYDHSLKMNETSIPHPQTGLELAPFREKASPCDVMHSRATYADLMRRIRPLSFDIARTSASDPRV
jgi:hypothetical protein